MLRFCCELAKTTPIFKTLSRILSNLFALIPQNIKYFQVFFDFPMLLKQEVTGSSPVVSTIYRLISQEFRRSSYVNRTF